MTVSADSSADFFAGSLSADASSEQAPLILVVEDDPDIARSVEIRLRFSGFRSVLASDFEAALRAVTGEPPAAALLDVSVPGGDGVTLMKRLHGMEGLRELPVIILTASLRPGLREEALEGGAKDYFTKPYEAAALMARLGELTRGAPGLS